MSDISARYRRLATAFADHVAQVPGERWASPSPCAGWTALDVVRHVVDTQRMPFAQVGRELGEIPDVDGDPLAAWNAARHAVQAELDDPERAAARYEGYFGPTTFEQTVDDFLCLDLLIHRWDLARTAGLDERLELDEVRRVHERALSFGEALRGPNVCGPAVEPPPGADEQARLLAYLGRRP